MSLFVDSNVTIGYVFSGDNWNSNATNVFNIPDPKYYSNNVLAETKHKVNIIKDEIFFNLLKISADLIKDNTLPDNLQLEELTRFISFKGLKKLNPYITKLFLNNYNFDAPKDMLSNDIKQLANNFLREYAINFSYIMSNLNLHKRKKDYPKLYALLESHTHHEDNIIYLDAHDLCKCGTNPLTFITADYQKRKADFIQKNTSIDEIKDLRDYYI